MTIFKGTLALAPIFVPTLFALAETHCPGSVESVPLRLVNGYEMIVGVSVGHSDRYDFLLDTGTQFTMIDPSLAAKLRVHEGDSIPVSGTGFQSTASSARIDQLEMGSHGVANLEAVVYNLQSLRSLGLHIQGVLGEDFLQHFDMLIDNEHRLLCLDDSGAMRAVMRGQHIALAQWSETDDVPPNSLIIAVHLSGSKRPIRLKLDSGANAPFLYSTSQYVSGRLSQGKSLQVSGTDGAQRGVVALPLQEVEIGSLELSKVAFYTSAGPSNDFSQSDFDGLMATKMFRRVFVCHAEHFAILEAR